MAPDTAGSPGQDRIQGSAARRELPIPERTGNCPFCGDPRRLWRVGNDRETVLICSACLFRAMREAQGD